MRAARLWITSSSLMILAGGVLLTWADEKKSPPPAPRETVAKPLSEKQKKKKEEQLRKELETPYRKWLNEDVAYIITDDARTAIKPLQTDEEREQFIEQFWPRRDPTPDTADNEDEEAHYRRLAAANEHFASGTQGWKTDRGRIHITFGPPDERDEHPSGGTYERPPEEGGGETTTYPFEDWRYRYIEGIGNDVLVEFVDPTMTGEYRMTMDPSEKDALARVPGAGLSLLEQMGMANKADRFNNTDGTLLPAPLGGPTARMNQFDRLDTFTKLQKPPAVKFKDLEAVVNSRVSYNILPMKVQADYFPVTESSVLTNITIQFDNRDLQFQSKDGVQKAVVNILGHVTTMTRRVVNTFEDTVTADTPPEMLQAFSKGRQLYQKTIPLMPGTYWLNVVAKDVVGGNLNNYEVALNVPRLDEDKLTTSTVVLADLLEKVPTNSIGAGPFVIGDSKVRPRMGNTFKRDEKMGIYLKAYNFEADEATHKPLGQVEYELTKNGSGEKIWDITEEVGKIPGASASQITIEKLMPLKDLAPGQYTLHLKITDQKRNQVLTPTAQ